MKASVESRLRQVEAALRGFSRRVETRSLTIQGTAGGARIDMHADSTSPEIAVRDDAGIVKLRFGLSIDGAPSLEFYDPSGKRCVYIGIPDEGSPRVVLFGNSEKPLIETSVSGFDRGVYIYGEDGHLLVGLEVTGETGRMTLNIDTNHVWVAPSCEVQPSFKVRQKEI